MEEAFEKVKGVRVVESGYTGGKEKNPTYEEVSRGKTKHVETVKVIYDENKVSYGKLLEVFWGNIDPLDEFGQFCDKGDQYKSGIFFSSPEQEKLAKKSLEEHQLSSRFKDKKLVTFIRKAGEFYPAEEFHQDYYKKNPLRYKFYKYTCASWERLTLKVGLSQFFTFSV